MAFKLLSWLVVPYIVILDCTGTNTYLDMSGSMRLTVFQEYKNHQDRKLYDLVLSTKVIIVWKWEIIKFSHPPLSQWVSFLHDFSMDWWTFILGGHQRNWYQGTCKLHWCWQYVHNICAFDKQEDVRISQNSLIRCQGFSMLETSLHDMSWLFWKATEEEGMKILLS